MNQPMKSVARSAAFERVRKVLDYIHANLQSPLSLEQIAEQSCWSRWQLQRVFQAQTDQTVVNYVRELKLSCAAELLLDSSTRIIDIALEVGFNSEISFSRAFKQHFGVSPSQYRKKAQRLGLRKPIEISQLESTDLSTKANFVEVRVDYRPAFIVKGLHTSINGLFSLSPDFSVKVPKLWRELEESAQGVEAPTNSFIGIIDLIEGEFDGSNIEYWAGIELHEGVPLPLLPSLISDKLELLNIPDQTYAVVKHKGAISGLPNTLQWFILNWLPNSGYRGIDGYELEIYPDDYQPLSDESHMEYWIPIAKV